MNKYLMLQILDLNNLKIMIQKYKIINLSLKESIEPTTKTPISEVKSAKITVPTPENEKQT